VDTILRLCEGGKVSHDLSRSQRAEVEEAASAWQEANNLSQTPLWFSGERVRYLHAAQNYVGVVEAGGVNIEVLPKLDAALLREDVSPDSRQAESVLSHLMWMLEVGDHGVLAETDTASLQEEPSSFFDLWAFLLGKHLLRELENGKARTYQYQEGDLASVRGRIQIGRQVTHNWNRMDHIACAWDEFTPDTPMNRLFKCSLRFLRSRVHHAAASQLTKSCLMFLDDVTDVDAATALSQTSHFRFDRMTERFRRTFELARRLLESHGHQLGVGDSNTFVFMVNMADVFENYVRGILEARYRAPIETQKFMGRLFPSLSKGGIHQYADFFWSCNEVLYIGDAKYKHLSANSTRPLRFADVEADETLAGRVLNAADVRQLTVYAELARRNHSANAVRLQLFYPYVGTWPPISLMGATESAWNGDYFDLVPVCPRRCTTMRHCLSNPIG
jgi:5-methylcytosine-specific restriction endonuclease McrBC regulatory subunit McrC